MDELTRRSDTSLVQRAVRSGWGIDEETKHQAKERCKILSNDPDPRLQISAIRALIEMDKIDQRDAHKQLDIERDANRSQVQNLTLNQFNLSPEAVYRLMDGMSSNVIEHES